MMHPLPWTVAYDQRFPEWSKFSLPRVVDANGDTVVTPKQHVGHPGQHDVKASVICAMIVTAVNRYMRDK
jgi:hypothetical protein